jgi:hypothetical protein
LSQSELDLFIQVVNEKGKKWSLFSGSIFPGKSQNTLKFTYLKYLGRNRASQNRNQEEKNEPINNKSIIQQIEPPNFDFIDQFDFFDKFYFD